MAIANVTNCGSIRLMNAKQCIQSAEVRRHELSIVVLQLDMLDKVVCESHKDVTIVSS
jgi:hypothetical protein